MNYVDLKNLRQEAADWLFDLAELDEGETTLEIESRFKSLASDFESLAKDLRSRSASYKKKLQERKETVSMWHTSLQSIHSLWSKSLLDMQASLRFQQRTHKNYESETRRTLRQLGEDAPQGDDVRNAIRMLTKARLITPRKLEDSFESSLNQHQHQPAGEFTLEELLDLSNVQTPAQKTSTKRAYKFLSNT